jgi:hypothetical protein
MTLGKTDKQEIALLMERIICPLCNFQITSKRDLHELFRNGIKVKVHKVCPEKE